MILPRPPHGGRKIRNENATYEKISRAHGGCLGTGSRRRTRQAAISRGEGHTPLTRGSPNGGTQQEGHALHTPPEHIGRGRTTRGTETSKYPEEEKSTEIARVAASESGPAQTRARESGRALPRRGLRGRVSRGCRLRGVTNESGSGTAWEGRRHRVRAPYADPRRAPLRHPSRAGHVKPGPNLGGPPSKAEHSPVTDSEPVP